MPRRKTSSEVKDYSASLGELIDACDFSDFDNYDLKTPMMYTEMELQYKERLDRFQKLDNWKSTGNCVLFIVLLISLVLGILITLKLY
jgi:hypothetical protein